MNEPLVRELIDKALLRNNKRVQSEQASYSDFVREGAAAGCAHYVVYINGKKVRYFGRRWRRAHSTFPQFKVKTSKQIEMEKAQ